MAACHTEFGPPWPWFFEVKRAPIDPSQLKKLEASGDPLPLCAVVFRKRLLEHWANLLRDDHEYAAGAGRLDQEWKPPTLCARLNGLLRKFEFAILVKDTDKFEKRLKKAAQTVANAIRDCKGGRNREAKRESFYKLHLWDEEIQSTHESAMTLEEFKAQSSDLQEASEALFQVMEAELYDKEETGRAAEDKNSQLEAYIEKLLEGQAGARCNKTLQESAPRTVRSKVATLRTTAQKALAFSRVYGLEVEALVLRDVGTADVSQII